MESSPFSKPKYFCWMAAFASQWFLKPRLFNLSRRNYGNTATQRKEKRRQQEEEEEEEENAVERKPGISAHVAGYGKKDGA